MVKKKKTIICNLKNKKVYCNNKEVTPIKLNELSKNNRIIFKNSNNISKNVTFSSFANYFDKKGFTFDVRFNIITIFLFIALGFNIYIFFNDSNNFFKLLSISLFLSIISFILTDKRVSNKKPYICDTSLFTPASIGHFFLYTLITLIIYLFTFNFLLAFIISQIIHVSWEYLEYKLTNIFYSLACENYANKIMDLILGIFGSLIVLLVI